MPTLGAVVVLSPDPADARRAVESMGADPRVELGAAEGHLLPVVLDVGSKEEERACWKGLEAMPGVLEVRLAYAEFSDLTTPGEGSSEVES